MSYCRNCHTKLPQNAKFCLECGAKVIEETFDCRECGVENPISAKLCSGCAYPFVKEEPKIEIETNDEVLVIETILNSKKDKIEELEKEVVEDEISEKEKINDLFDKTPLKKLEQKIYEDFLVHLKEKIKEEQDSRILEEYMHRFGVSEFKFSFEIKTKHLAEEVKSKQEKNRTNTENIDRFLRKEYNTMSDFFLIHYCSDLNSVKLSERILQYQNIEKSKVNLLQMCLDYLNFEEEKETTYYTDFVEMPMDRLRVAGKSFLFPEKDERIFLICDQSVLGSLKEGFALTEKALYWRMHFEKPRKLLFSNLQEVVREKDWIKINGQFFNADKSLNIKLLKLLRKINEFDF